MSIESQPRDNKPEFEPSFDVMRRLLDEQAIHDDCEDELDQISHMAGVLSELNRKLDDPIRAKIRHSACGIEYQGYEPMIGASTKSGEGMTATGYIGGINYGILLGIKGYMIHLVDPDVKHVHPEHPDDEPVYAQFIIPVSNVHGYEYLPIETSL